MIKIFCNICKKEIIDPKYLNVVSHFNAFDARMSHICSDCVVTYSRAMEIAIKEKKNESNN